MDVQFVVAAYVTVCTCLMGIPLVAVIIVAIRERARRYERRPGFEVKITEVKLLTVPSTVQLEKEDDHG